MRERSDTYELRFEEDEDKHFTRNLKYTESAEEVLRNRSRSQA